MARKLWIKGYEGIYEVCEEGNIYSHKTVSKGGKLTPSKTTKGYLQVFLYKDNVANIFRVHRLVADAFLEDVEGKDQIDHINNNKEDNRLVNLKRVNNQENSSKALSKTYHLFHKDGRSIIVNNLERWCRTNKYHSPNFYRLLNKQRKTAYGFNLMEVGYGPQRGI